jgi:hypothetical protein
MASSEVASIMYQAVADIACHVIHTHTEPAFIELSGIL